MCDEKVAFANPQSTAHPRTIAGSGSSRKTVVDASRRETPLLHLLLGRQVDCDVAPVSVVDRQFADVSETLPLPRRVVVVHYRGPTPQHRCGCSSRRKVERNGAEVLNYYKIRVGQRFDQLRRRWWVCRRNGQAGYCPVDGSFAGNGDDLEPQLLDRSPPVAGHHRHPVGHSQPKRDECTLGHDRHDAR